MTELRGLLGSFLFSADDVFKPIGVLSGGERNRYALARTLLHPSNFLLLDEPTNHLDMRAKDVLLESLEKYNGTVVFVSHDRYFIDKLATRIFEVGDGRVEVFPGNYEDYLWRKQRGGASADADSSGEARNDYPTLSDVPGYVEPKADSRKRLNPIKLKQMQDRCQQLEEDIASLEHGVEQCERELQSFVSPEETQRQTDLLAQRRADLGKLMKEWEELSTLMET
jgi:ATP-binding cassette subfamily F protein 3